jgi:hypothetical protein
MTDPTSSSENLDTLNDILQYAPAEYDGDASIDAVAVRYVRDLEAANTDMVEQLTGRAVMAAELAVLRAQRAAALALADQADRNCVPLSFHGPAVSTAGLRAALGVQPEPGNG